jgi:hypothetical protein
MGTALLIACCLLGGALGFEAEEHKLVGDLGSSGAISQKRRSWIPKHSSVKQTGLLAEYDGRTDYADLDTVSRPYSTVVCA